MGHSKSEQLRATDPRWLHTRLCDLLAESPHPMTPKQMILHLKSENAHNIINNLGGRIRATLVTYPKDFIKVAYALYTSPNARYLKEKKEEPIRQDRLPKGKIYTIDEIISKTQIPKSFIRDNISVLGQPMKCYVDKKMGYHEIGVRAIKVLYDKLKEYMR